MLYEVITPGRDRRIVPAGAARLGGGIGDAGQGGQREASRRQPGPVRGPLPGRGPVEGRKLRVGAEGLTDGRAGPRCRQGPGRVERRARAAEQRHGGRGRRLDEGRQAYRPGRADEQVRQGQREAGLGRVAGAGRRDGAPETQPGVGRLEPQLTVDPVDARQLEGAGRRYA